MKIKLPVVILSLVIIGIHISLWLLSSPKEEPSQQVQSLTFSVETQHDENGIRVTWNPVSGANNYKVYRQYISGKDSELLGDTIELSYLDENIKSGQRAKYYVIAIKGGQEVGNAESEEDVIYRVCIETGHGIDENGKWDTGCTWNENQEAQMMIPITRAMCDYLRKSGVSVHTDAYTENESNLLAMLDYLDNHDINAFVNVHCDYEDSESGTLQLYNTEEQKKLAQCLNEGVHEEIEISDRGLEYRDDLDTLCNEKVHCPACLFETGCIKRDFKILTEQYDAYGKGLAKGVCKYLGISFSE